ncbi:hypothetical protein B0H14DRAFT_2714395 [Mycena olivaceomarginata]|nr:hypothetical protein B0H14DRAFT_2714395 [Mycena olivaceomarginata]
MATTFATDRAILRGLQLLELENEQQMEDAEAFKLTEEQRLQLFNSFHSVKFEWSDLDGMASSSSYCRPRQFAVLTNAAFDDGTAGPSALQASLLAASPQISHDSTRTSPQATPCPSIQRPVSPLPTAPTLSSPELLKLAVRPFLWTDNQWKGNHRQHIDLSVSTDGSPPRLVKKLSKMFRLV